MRVTCACPRAARDCFSAIRSSIPPCLIEFSAIATALVLIGHAQLFVSKCYDVHEIDEIHFVPLASFRPSSSSFPRFTANQPTRCAVVLNLAASARSTTNHPQQPAFSSRILPNFCRSHLHGVQHFWPHQTTQQ